MRNVVKLSGQTAARIDAEQDALDGKALLRSPKGLIKACEHKPRLIGDAPQYAGPYFDEFLSRLRIDCRDWTDADDLEALCWLQSAHEVSAFTLGQARNGARAVAYSRRRDSLREFVESLPDWDGTERIDLAFADAWGVPDTPVTRAASRNLLIAAIARAMRPGAQVDTVWCFEGPQGTYKSQSMQRWADSSTPRFPRRSAPRTSCASCAASGSPNCRSSTHCAAGRRRRQALAVGAGGSVRREVRAARRDVPAARYRRRHDQRGRLLAGHHRRAASGADPVRHDPRRPHYSKPAAMVRRSAPPVPQGRYLVGVPVRHQRGAGSATGGGSVGGHPARMHRARSAIRSRRTRCYPMARGLDLNQRDHG